MFLFLLFGVTISALPEENVLEFFHFVFLNYLLHELTTLQFVSPAF